MAQQDWDIKPRGELCTGCHAAFADAQAFHAILVHGPDGYTRHDFCETCWPDKGTSLQAYSVWRGVFRSAPPKAEEPLKKETAEALLRKLIEEDAAPNMNVIYILAIMLERKRILIERDVKHTEDTTIRIYEHRKSGETFVITDPHLRMDQIEHVQQDVIVMLSTHTLAQDAAAAAVIADAPGNTSGDTAPAGDTPHA